MAVASPNFIAPALPALRLPSRRVSHYYAPTPAGGLRLPSRRLPHYAPAGGKRRRAFSSSSPSHRHSPAYPDVSSRPFRSMLYVPCSNSRALQKLDSLSGGARPDGVMFDLEDGVSPLQKCKARANLEAFLCYQDTSSYFGLVRINKRGTEWYGDDVVAASEMVGGGGVRGAVVPKIESVECVEEVSRAFNEASGSGSSSEDGDNEGELVRSAVPLWAMIETPLSVLNVGNVARHPSLQGLILGTNDLSKELQVSPSTKSTSTTREGLKVAIQTTILAARAHKKVVIDGVYNKFADIDGLREEVLQARNFGADGKTLLHPNQIPPTNEILAPTDEEVEYSRRVVECWEEATSGEDFAGVAVLNGSLVEELHAVDARRLLERAAMIEEMAGV